jgi:preprotein translocase subunit SecF
MEWIKPGTTYDFVGQRRRWYLISGIAVALSLLMFFGGAWVDLPVSPKWGVDFTGGTEIHVKVQEGVDAARLRDALGKAGISSATVQSFGGGGDEFLVRIETVNVGAEHFFQKVKAKLEADYGAQAWRGFDWNLDESLVMTARPVEAMPKQDLQAKLVAVHPQVVVEESTVDATAVEIPFPGLIDAVTRSLTAGLEAGADGKPAFEVTGVESVGPSVGAELRRKGIVSIVLSLVIILVYVAFRFDLAFAPGAIIAVFHDVIVTVGCMCILQREFTTQTIAVLLTIVGYSVNDTIVVYDRIRENMRRSPDQKLEDVINLSVNETLGRTILTSFATQLAVIAMVIFGGPVLRDFSIALTFGFISGVYSTIFIASPITIALQRWVPVQMGEVAKPVDQNPNAGAVV